MKASNRLIAKILICAGFALAPIAYAEPPPTTPAAAAKPTPVPAGGMGNGVMKCAPESMKGGQCPQGGMDNDHMEQMHAHMQKMHPQTSSPAGGAVTGAKKPEPENPIGAEEHSVHHPAQ